MTPDINNDARPQDEATDEKKQADWACVGKNLLNWPLEKSVGFMYAKGDRTEALAALIQVRNSNGLIEAMKALQTDLRESSKLSRTLKKRALLVTWVLAISALVQATIMVVMFWTSPRDIHRNITPESTPALHTETHPTETANEAHPIISPSSPDDAP